VLAAAMEEKDVADRAIPNEAVRRANHTIAARLYRDIRRTKEEDEKLQRAVAQSHQDRATAVLALKKSTATAMAHLAGANEARQKRITRINNERERERRELLAAGRNPDAVFGARDEASRQQAHVTKMKAKVTEKALSILDRMVAEDMSDRKKEKEARKHVAAVDAYRRSMGRSILETAVAEHVKTKAAASTNGLAALHVGLGGLSTAAAPPSRGLPSSLSSSHAAGGARDAPVN
jgi:hypothetical protein